MLWVSKSLSVGGCRCVEILVFWEVSILWPRTWMRQQTTGFMNDRTMRKNASQSCLGRARGMIEQASHCVRVRVIRLTRRIVWRGYASHAQDVRLRIVKRTPQAQGTDCMYARTRTRTTHTHTHTHTHIRTRTHAHTHAHKMQTNTNTHTHTNKQTNKQTNKHARTYTRTSDVA